MLRCLPRAANPSALPSRAASPGRRAARGDAASPLARARAPPPPSAPLAGVSGTPASELPNGGAVVDQGEGSGAARGAEGEDGGGVLAALAAEVAGLRQREALMLKVGLSAMRRGGRALCDLHLYAQRPAQPQS
jgi:hypothetical protein